MLQTLSWATKGSPQAGDVAGQGVTTMQLTTPQGLQADQQSIAGVTIGQAAEGTWYGNPVSGWIALLILYVAIRYFAPEGKEYMSIWHIIDITAAAIIGLSVSHWFFAKVNVKALGASQVVLSA